MLLYLVGISRVGIRYLHYFCSTHHDDHSISRQIGGFLIYNFTIPRRALARPRTIPRPRLKAPVGAPRPLMRQTMGVEMGIAD